MKMFMLVYCCIKYRFLYDTLSFLELFLTLYNIFQIVHRYVGGGRKQLKLAVHELIYERPVHSNWNNHCRGLYFSSFCINVGLLIKI